MAKKDAPEISTVNFLGNGTTIKGDVNSNGDIRIDGTVAGFIKSTGKVIVGASGKVEGEIVCVNAELEGTLQVKITVSELLSLKASSNMKGDIIANKLAIEPGAKFTGTCRMEDPVAPVNKVKPE